MLNKLHCSYCVGNRECMSRGSYYNEQDFLIIKVNEKRCIIIDTPKQK